MHAAFLYHAIDAGLDMGIVNAGMIEVYDEIDKDMLTYVEDVLLNRRDDATERLIDYAEQFKGQKGKEDDKSKLAWRESSVEERLSHAPWSRASVTLLKWTPKRPAPSTDALCTSLRGR